MQQTQQQNLRFPQSSSRADATVSTAGHLLDLELENFMCHEYRKIVFGQHVTIINGKNGSGKSALIAALQILFGARAMTTQRANSAGELVRHGAQEAKIVLRMSNKGDDAFEHDLLGDVIVITKVIPVKGASRVTIESGDPGHKFKERGTKVLQAISNHFNIMVDSPATVLTQD